MSQSNLQLLKQAIACHQAGELMQAGKLYQTILQNQPNHPEANHNLGLIAVQIGQPADGLAYFISALDAEPACRHYWLSYIDALYLAGHQEDAATVLALARKQGLEGQDVEALALRLKQGSAVIFTDESDTEVRLADRIAPHQDGRPSYQQMDALVALVGGGQFAEAALLAREMTQRFPQHEFGWKALGVALKQLGRGLEALAPMRQAIALSPTDVEVHYNLGVVLQELGLLNEAEASYRSALVIKPDYADALANLGVTLNKLDRMDEAEQCLVQALHFRPDHAEARSNLGATLHKLGRLEEAEATYRRLLQIKPQDPAALTHLGAVLQGLGQFDEAETSVRQALESKPEFAEAHSRLGSILLETGRLKEAEASLAQSLRIDPNNAHVLANRGDLLHRMERPNEAEDSFRQALKISPDDVRLHARLGDILQQMERPADAEASFRRALKISPSDARLHVRLGHLLRESWRLEEAEVSYRRALEITPDDYDVLQYLGTILLNLERWDEAEACFRGVLKRDPENALTMGRLGTTLLSLGRFDEAEAYYRRALALQPESSKLHSNFLYLLTLGARRDAESLFLEHARFSEKFETHCKAHWPAHVRSPDPEHAIRIGFVSADFYNHAVASFLEPVLTSLSNHPRLILHGYHNNRINDDVTQRLKLHFVHWSRVDQLSDAALADRIQADRIDILIDLSGHTAHNRLETFARKPAPVQASWMGYPGTTGLAAMDYYLADRFLLPQGQFDAQFSEKIVRLPANSPFLPFEGAPTVNALPAIRNGYVTFGSFNRPNKLNHTVIALWSQLLRALPDSRMLLGAMPAKGGYETLTVWFAREGIARERLDFHPRSSMDQYLRLHQQIDLCLDTFPYNGGTTTLHGLWMGVPTLTLAGATPAGRTGACILNHAGLQAMVAQDQASFVANGLYWARNLHELARTRSELRARLEKSVICQPKVIADALAHALKFMWQQWCAGYPAKSFEVESPMTDLDHCAISTNRLRAVDVLDPLP